MKLCSARNLLATAAILIVIPMAKGWGAEKVIRPEEIKSKRQIIYDDATYAKLNQLWKQYYDKYPSEYAYANWMYAARYAADSNYSDLLAKGLGKYMANPTLLYLKALEQNGSHNNSAGREYLEKAVALDQNYADPWFVLAINYMDSGDDERLDLALRHLLDIGIVADEVMDYNFNVLTSLDENAILITNGDNDTYPGWILTRILKVRPDVTIVNRSLLNTDWYPLYVIDHGLPQFIGKNQLEELRDSILKQIKRDRKTISLGGPFSDTLILRLIDSARPTGRPVYFAKTIFLTEMLKAITEQGRDLGLVTLVSMSEIPVGDQVKRVYTRWVDSFRTGGLQSWRLRHSPETDAGRMLVSNYADGILTNLGALKNFAPELRLKLFRWYEDYIEQILSSEKRSLSAVNWCCGASDVKEIDAWSKQQGVKCEEHVKP